MRAALKPVPNQHTYVPNAEKKEITKTMHLIAQSQHNEDRLSEPVRVVWYMSRSGDGASPVYCQLRVYADENHVGAGKARGYGYCKTSAAFQDACDEAGIELSNSVAGVGTGAVRDTILAIGTALGYSKMRIEES